MLAIFFQTSRKAAVFKLGRRSKYVDYMEINRIAAFSAFLGIGPSVVEDL
jgi:hypothetical protein